MSKAYYNEFDKKAAAWLRELIRRGLIANGDVDERSINDVRADELRGYTQCHFFAGIGGWSLALRLAGWPDDREVWTGSCPCQPFSVAGKGLGTADERHLWPVFAKLIAERKPSACFGEQVASRAGREWLAGVRADLEGMGYAVGAADLCAASVGAPHIRQRLFWMADAGHECRRRWTIAMPEKRAEATNDCRLGESDASGPQGAHNNEFHAGRIQCESPQSGGRATGWMADAGLLRGEHATEWRRREDDNGPRGRLCDAASGGLEQGNAEKQAGLNGETTAWSNCVTIPCGDGKARRIEPGLAPLVDGLPKGVVHGCDNGISLPTPEARVMRLRGYGNAIIPGLAKAFIRASVEAASEI